MTSKITTILREATLQACAVPGLWAIISWLLGRNDLSFVPWLAVAGFLGTAIGRWIYLRRREESQRLNAA
jgi:uncharacterized membrane protein YfcA